MKLTINPAKNDVLTADNQNGWLQMAPFGAGYLTFASRDNGEDFEPAAALSDEANEALADLPVDDTADSGWASVSSRMHTQIRSSIWSALSSAIDLRPAHTVPQVA